MTKDERKLAWGVGIAVAVIAGLALVGGDAKAAGDGTRPAPTPPPPGAPGRMPVGSIVSVNVERPDAALAQPPSERELVTLRGLPEDRVLAARLNEEIVRLLRDRGYAARPVRFRSWATFPPNQNLVVAVLEITGDQGGAATAPASLAPGLAILNVGVPPRAADGALPAARPPAPQSGYTFRGP